jgi:hypothetical protein
MRAWARETGTRRNRVRAADWSVALVSTSFTTSSGMRAAASVREVRLS